jgi:hypothetical protein
LARLAPRIAQHRFGRGFGLAQEIAKEAEKSHHDGRPALYVSAFAAISCETPIRAQ